MIRKATWADAPRLCEIMVFNNRRFYFPLFGDIGYAFGTYTVGYLMELFQKNPNVLVGCWVYEDIVIRGFVCVLADGEVFKLHVEEAFQNEGVGAALIEYAKQHLGARRLWVLEKNPAAIRFYRRHGFEPDGTRKQVEGAKLYVIGMRLKTFEE